jgi:hypothetical protein
MRDALSGSLAHSILGGSTMVLQFAARKRVRTAVPAMAIVLLAGIGLVPRSDVRAQAASPSINFHFVGAGEHPRKNSCFRLAASVGQTAPGYASGSTNSLVAGFQAAAPTASEQDQLFFNGFEDC